MLTRTEIRLAAEAIACTVSERGGNEDAVEAAINRAFKNDHWKERETAQYYAAAWMAAADLERLGINLEALGITPD